RKPRACSPTPPSAAAATTCAGSRRTSSWVSSSPPAPACPVTATSRSCPPARKQPRPKHPPKKQPSEPTSAAPQQPTTNSPPGDCTPGGFVVRCHHRQRGANRAHPPPGNRHTHPRGPVAQGQAIGP